MDPERLREVEDAVLRALDRLPGDGRGGGLAGQRADPLPTHVEDATVLQLVGERPSTDPVAGLEDDDPHPVRAQVASGAQSGETAPDDDHVGRARAVQAVRGYRMTEVDWVLDRLAEEIERLAQERDELAEKLAVRE